MSAARHPAALHEPEMMSTAVLRYWSALSSFDFLLLGICIKY